MLILASRIETLQTEPFRTMGLKLSRFPGPVHVSYPSLLKKVKQKSGLNRSILDQGWGEFRRQLEYKSAWNGGVVVAVAPQYTSQTCPCCGHVSKENRRTQARFECVDCGYENNADVVGAINVLERGYRLLACGETVKSGRSVKQEPAEATTQELALV